LRAAKGKAVPKRGTLLKKQGKAEHRKEENGRIRIFVKHMETD